MTPNFGLIPTVPLHRYWIFRSWGRVGTVIGSNKLEEMPSKEDAVEHFMKLYEEKTGNDWHSKNFTKYPKKFYPLEIDYGQVREGDNAFILFLFEEIILKVQRKGTTFTRKSRCLKGTLLSIQQGSVTENKTDTKPG